MHRWYSNTILTTPGMFLRGWYCPFAFQFTSQLPLHIARRWPNCSGLPRNYPALSRTHPPTRLAVQFGQLQRFWFPEVPETPPRPRSMAPPASRSSGGGTGVSIGGWGDAPLARALFAYLSSGENQLSFLEGDLIALMGKSSRYSTSIRMICIDDASELQ